MSLNKSNLIEAGIFTSAMVMTEGIVMSGYLHRCNTHGSVKFNPKIQQIAEATNWLLSGMKPLEWKVTHLTHHEFQDSEPKAEEWEQIQQKYPGAPIEVFRDPHSPILESHLKILVGNGAHYYPKAAKKILPYLESLEKNNVPRDQWPDHLSAVDLNQSKFEQTIDKIPHGRMLGLVAVGGALLATRGPKKALTTESVYIAGVLLLGGGVNMLGHTGQVTSEFERLKVILGIKPAVPDDKGSYASNFFKKLAFLTAGEANHADHHRNPGNPFITSKNKIYKDPTGVLINFLSKISINGKPLASLPNKRAEQTN